MSCFCIRLQKDVVKTLDFRHCGLAFIPQEVYEYEETLEELYLDSNNIKDLPRSLFHCEFLQKLSICDNDLRSIPNAIATLVNLEELDISKNGIVELPDSIRSCKNLNLVEISVNPLGKLPEGFTQLVNLTQLYLNDTLLDYLPANFGRLVKLTVLELRENRLKALPRSMSRLTELERLDLGMNQFRQLPEVIGFFTKLTELWLDSNKLTAVPPEIGNLKDLVYFDASCNRIESLPQEIEGLRSLTDLHLSKNYLQQLPKTIGQLSNLQNLILDCNQLSSLPYSIGGLVSLEELILTYNNLEELPPSIGLLRKLSHLNADQNMLLELPSELGSCSSISLLSLHSNLLLTIPDEIGHISKLTVANLSNNQLRYLPYNITKLKKLQALWLSENQSKPLIPLQSEMRDDLGKRVLTCFLFPQQHRDAEEDFYQSDGESFHASMLEDRLSRRQIAFDVAESDSEHKVKRTSTPYPKESIKRNILASSRSGSSKSSKSRRVNILPNYPVVDTSRRSEKGHPREGKPRRSRSPGSPISDSLHLFQADKEIMAKDKARLKGSSSAMNRTDSDTESVASSARERVVGRREMRARMDHVSASDTEAFIRSPVWSHTGGTNRNKQMAMLNHVEAPSRSNMSRMRGYESDQVDGGARMYARSPNVPQKQVRHATGSRGGGVGYSRGYESDQIVSPVDVYGQRRTRNHMQMNRNSNATGSDVDERRALRTSNRRSSGYSTDPGYKMLPAVDRELRMANVKQKRDEMLPPPYYRVRQLRGSEHSRSSHGNPRRHPFNEQPQNFTDYGWIDVQLPPNTDNSASPVNSQPSSQNTSPNKRNQPGGSDSRTQVPSGNFSSKERHLTSRGNPYPHSDTEVASRKINDKTEHPRTLDVRQNDNALTADRSFHSRRDKESPVLDQSQDTESGYKVRQDRTLKDDKKKVSPGFGETQEKVDSETHQHRLESWSREGRQKYSPASEENRHGKQENRKDQNHHIQGGNSEKKESTWNHPKSTYQQNERVPEQKNWQSLETTDKNGWEYQKPLEDRHKSATLPTETSPTETSPTETSRSPNQRGSNSLPRDAAGYQPNTYDTYKSDAGIQQKSSSFPGSEFKGHMTEDDSRGDRVNNYQQPNSRRKMRLHGGAPNYSASEPDLGRNFQPQPSAETLRDQGPRQPSMEPQDGTSERRSQDTDYGPSKREPNRFLAGPMSSTPSVESWARPQTPGGSRPHSPANDIPQRRSRPGSPTDFQQVLESSNRQENPQDPKLSRPAKLPLRTRESRPDYAPDSPSYQPSTIPPPRGHLTLLQGPWRDSVHGGILTPVSSDIQHHDRGRVLTPDLDPHHGLISQSTGNSGQELWRQDSSGYASDQNEQVWRRASCSTPTSSVFLGPSSPPMWRPGSDVTPNHRSRHPSSDQDKLPAIKRIPVVIYKNPGLGFSITGGRDAPGNQFRPFDWGIFVTKIQPGGPADGILRPGDKLLEVNGRLFDSILHDEAVKLLRRSNPVSILLQREDTKA